MTASDTVVESETFIVGVAVGWIATVIDSLSVVVSELLRSTAEVSISMFSETIVVSLVMTL